MTSTAFEIPLRAEQQQISVTLKNQSYTLVITWCDPQQYWVLEIQDDSGNRIIGGIPFVTGADLLAQYEYLGIGGALVVQTDTNALAVPTYDNLGQTAHLYFITN
jgi:hypothetical protein